MESASRKGLRYEDRARQYLLARGLRLLEQNYRSRFGEIDLIMQERDTICFVEVKYRGSRSLGGALDALPLRKRRKIVKTALFYLARHRRLASRDLRFDALLIEAEPNGGERIEWIKNAFYAE